MNFALLVYFQTSLVPLNFDKYNLRYSSLIYRCPIMAHFQTRKSDKLVKIHSLSFCPEILCAYNDMNPLLKKLSLT